MIPRGASLLDTFTWCILSSLPQPLLGVPAYLFVEDFRAFFPVGLGFAAGAMVWVAVFELATEALEELKWGEVFVIMSISGAALSWFQANFV